MEDYQTFIHPNHWLQKIGKKTECQGKNKTNGNFQSVGFLFDPSLSLRLPTMEPESFEPKPLSCACTWSNMGMRKAYRLTNVGFQSSSLQQASALSRLAITGPNHWAKTQVSQELLEVWMQSHGDLTTEGWSQRGGCWGGCLLTVVAADRRRRPEHGQGLESLFHAVPRGFVLGSHRHRRTLPFLPFAFRGFGRTIAMQVVHLLIAWAWFGADKPRKMKVPEESQERSKHKSCFQETKCVLDGGSSSASSS